jgi:hypothetical protein
MRILAQDEYIGDPVDAEALQKAVYLLQASENSNIHALPPAQPGIDVQKLLKAVYKHQLLGEYEKAVITGIVRELQEDESEVEK